MVERRFAKYGIVVVQGYGSTESAPACTVLDDKDATKYRGSVGKLVPNMEARLLDDDERDVKEGERGELWIRGPNVMKWVLSGGLSGGVG
jgi:4-coumarate--CoA ligase